MAVSIPCPQCRAVMRSVNPIPAGKKIKCPKCATVFPAPNGVVAGKPSAPGTANKPAAMPNKPGVTPNKPSGTGGVVANKPSAAGTARVASSKPSATGSAKPAGRRKGGRLKLIFALVMLVGLLGGGFWVYSQFTGSSTETSNGSSQASVSQPATTNTPPPPLKVSDDPLFYLPPDSTLLAGVEPLALLKVPVLKDNADLILSGPEIGMMVAELKRSTGLGLEDLERVVLAGSGALTADRPESLVVVARTRAPVDAKKLSQLPDVLETKKAGNRPYYTLKSSALTQPFEVRACCTPTDRLIVLAMGSARRVEDLMGNPGTSPSLSPELLPLLRKVEKSQVWAIAPLDDALRKQMEGLLAMGPAMVPELADPVKALAQARAGGFWIGINAQEVRISVGVLCPSEAVAKDISGGLGVLWTKSKQPLQEQFGPVIKELQGDVRALVEDVFKSSVITGEAELAHASIRLNMAPIEGLVKVTKAVGPQALVASVQQSLAKGGLGPAGAAPGGDNEKALLEVVNKARAEEEVPKLKPDPKLFAAALAQAKVAAKDSSFDAVKLEEIQASVKEAGYQAQALTANLAIAPGKEKPDPADIIKKWMNDEASKRNLLNKDYNECGIGMAASAGDELFVVLIFAKK